MRHVIAWAAIVIGVLTFATTIVMIWAMIPTNESWPAITASACIGVSFAAFGLAAYLERDKK